MPTVKIKLMFEVQVAGALSIGGSVPLVAPIGAMRAVSITTAICSTILSPSPTMGFRRAFVFKESNFLWRYATDLER